MHQSSAGSAPVFVFVPSPALDQNKILSSCSNPLSFFRLTNAIFSRTLFIARSFIPPAAHWNERMRKSQGAHKKDLLGIELKALTT